MQQSPDQALINAAEACHEALRELTPRGREQVMIFIMAGFLAEHLIPMRDQMTGRYVRLLERTLARYNRQGTLAFPEPDA